MTSRREASRTVATSNSSRRRVGVESEGKMSGTNDAPHWFLIDWQKKPIKNRIELLKKILAEKKGGKMLYVEEEILMENIAFSLPPSCWDEKGRLI